MPLAVAVGVAHESRIIRGTKVSVDRISKVSEVAIVAKNPTFQFFFSLEYC